MNKNNKKFNSKPMHTVKSTTPTSWKNRLPAFVLLAFMVFWTIGSIFAVRLAFDNGKSNSGVITASAEERAVTVLPKEDVYYIPLYEIPCLQLYSNRGEMSFNSITYYCGLPIIKLDTTSAYGFSLVWGEYDNLSNYQAPFDYGTNVKINNSNLTAGTFSITINRVVIDYTGISEMSGGGVSAQFAWSIGQGVGTDFFIGGYNLKYKTTASYVSLRYEFILYDYFGNLYTEDYAYCDINLRFTSSLAGFTIPLVDSSYFISSTSFVTISENVPTLQYASTKNYLLSIVNGADDVYDYYITTIAQLEKSLSLHQDENTSLRAERQSLQNTISSLRKQVTDLTNQLQTEYKRGYEDGQNVGYTNGYNDGLNDSNQYSFTSLIGAVIDVPVQTFLGLFDFELLDVNMASFFLSLLTLAVILAIVKVFI